MEQGFSEWVILEYIQIICDVGCDNVILSSLPEGTTKENIPKRLIELGLKWTTKSLDKIQEQFMDIPSLKEKRVCLLDPRAKEDLSPDDSGKYDYFVFGGILGDHPPRDRTRELMEQYPNMLVGKRLGSKQMTTDTAVRTTQLIIEKKINFESINFIDYPEFRFNANEAIEMPFRYVLNSDGRPILPQGMIELIKKDSEQSIEDLLMTD